MQLVIVYDGFDDTIGPDGLFFGISSLRASFHNFGMASPCFLLTFCGLRFAVCGLRFAVCGLRFAVPLRGVEHETTNPRTNL